jgi:pimeloyl-ACP methyl ester carboxylesterase
MRPRDAATRWRGFRGLHSTRKRAHALLLRAEEHAMPYFERDGISLYFEETGKGFPLLVFAPGGMRSSIEYWQQSPFDPRREFSGEFRVVAMDQRNAGRSRAPVRANDGWHSYTGDHLALLDHLGIDQCHVLGGCIGSSYCLGLAERVTERVTSAVLQNPIGLHENRDAFYEMFDGWATSLREGDLRPDPDAIARFRESMYGGDFVFNVSREFLRGCRTPLLVLAGSDLYHPAPISEEIADLAPEVELLRKWKEPEATPGAVDRVRAFLRAHTPV